MEVGQCPKINKVNSQTTEKSWSRILDKVSVVAAVIRSAPPPPSQMSFVVSWERLACHFLSYHTTYYTDDNDQGASLSKSQL